MIQGDGDDASVGGLVGQSTVFLFDLGACQKVGAGMDILCFVKIA